MARSEHEKLEVYRRALEAARRAEEIALELPAPRMDLRDQLRRASTSVVLNIAEGAGEFSPAEKARFYRMARRSAGECLAIYDIVEQVLRLRIDATLARGSLDEVTAMLTRMLAVVEARRR